MDSKPSLAIAGGERDTIIVCRNSQGNQVRATPLRLSRHMAVFEVYNPYSIIQLSEVLQDFQIVMNERLVFSGRAVVSNLVNTGIILVCEVSLDEGWLDVDIFSPVNQRAKLLEEVGDFVKEWEKIHKVGPNFKVVVADMQALFMDLRRWMEQIELGVRSQPAGDRSKIETEVIEELEAPIAPVVQPLFDRFEEISIAVEETLQPAHRTYVKKQLHPLVLCSPFVYRTYQKPLGYAGDYEMVNMMLRSPYEGGSLFAKALNKFFLNTPPVVAHRNRIAYLTETLEKETKRVMMTGRRARFYNLGCGPAKEIQDFLAGSELSSYAELTLLDFNDETLRHTRQSLEQARSNNRRNATIKLIKKSVHQILKEAGKPVSEFSPGSFDMVYCAGLFDYLSDRICQRLMNIFYDLLAPGGLLVATNVHAANPSRNWMEYVVDWHLVYRNEKQLKALSPEKAPEDAFQVRCDATGVNIFIEVRKPGHA